MTSRAVVSGSGRALRTGGMCAAQLGPPGDRCRTGSYSSQAARTKQPFRWSRHAPPTWSPPRYGVGGGGGGGGGRGSGCEAYDYQRYDHQRRVGHGSRSSQQARHGRLLAPPHHCRSPTNPAADPPSCIGLPSVRPAGPPSVSRDVGGENGGRRVSAPCDQTRPQPGGAGWRSSTPSMRRPSAPAAGTTATAAAQLVRAQRRRREREPAVRSPTLSRRPGSAPTGS